MTQPEPTAQPTVLLARRAFFSSGLRLARADWSPERNLAVWGKRSRPHGANYTLDVFYSGPIAREDGMIVNLDQLKPLLSELVAPLDGADLSESPFLAGQVPTLEHIARALWQRLPTQLGAGQRARVRLQEGTRRWCEVARAQHDMKVTTTYEFAAAHRLHAPSKSEGENASLYGKCNNPRGHGHNYGLEVTVSGEPDEQSGEVIAQPVLDAIVEREVFERFDHKHLNEDCPEFKDAGLIPTSENLARVIFQVLEPALREEGVRLARVGLHETMKNYFEVEAPVA